jgi:hypothetical protein
MGENARYNGQLVKIGTCEDMYYLRADQIGQVSSVRGSADPGNAEDQKEIRFRFPWPDEDNVAPGAFTPYDREVGLYGVTVPAEVEHGKVQFTAHAGYVVSLPCPEGPDADPRVARNGFAGPVRFGQQAYRDGVLALICECGGCGAKYRVPTLADAQPIIDRMREEQKARGGDWYGKVADRIEAGYLGTGFRQAEVARIDAAARA